MNNYNYTDGLEILFTLELDILDLNMAQVERFKENFEVLYSIHSSKYRQITYPDLIKITGNSYASVTDDFDEKLKTEFYEKLSANSELQEKIRIEKLKNSLASIVSLI